MKANLTALRLVAIPLALAISACGSSEDAAVDDEAVATMEADPMAEAEPAGPVATANFQTAEGAEAGTATIESRDGALMLMVQVSGLPAGEHGAHVHTTGTCDAPSFESAGGHWNPADKMHGLENPEGQHAGDMPNLVIAGDGTGTLEYALKGGTAAGLLDADGAAMVIHATTDDQKTDPSGDSGPRIACGVFNAGEAGASSSPAT